MNLQIMTPRRVVFEGEAASIFLPGDRGEFELLPYHSPLISLLVEGDVIVDWRTRIHIPKGVVKCLNDQVVLLAEEPVLVDGQGPPVTKAAGKGVDG